jgi:hypothetical protein
MVRAWPCEVDVPPPWGRDGLWSLEREPIAGHLEAEPPGRAPSRTAAALERLLGLVVRRQSILSVERAEVDAPSASVLKCSLRFMCSPVRELARLDRPHRQRSHESINASRKRCPYIWPSQKSIGFGVAGVDVLD